MNYDAAIFAMIPVDTTGLPRVPEMPLPKPSIEHTLRNCDDCGRQAWIGPAQLAQYRQSGGVTLCYFCAIPVMRFLNSIQPEEVSVVSLDPEADKKPRRT